MTKRINKIIKILVTSDFFLNYGWGLLSPVFAIFLLQNIAQNNPIQAAKIAGLASLFYWIPKSILQIPIGHYLDKNHGDKDDFWCMIMGNFLVGFTPLGFLISSSPWQIYLFQIFHAVGMAATIPSWMAIFTRHIDKGKEALEWSIESTFIGFGAGIAGGIGGLVAAAFGFKVLFISVSIFTFISTVLLLFIRKNLSSQNIPVPRPPIKPFIEP